MCTVGGYHAAVNDLSSRAAVARLPPFQTKRAHDAFIGHMKPAGGAHAAVNEVSTGTQGSPFAPAYQNADLI